MLNMDFVLAIAEDHVPSTQAARPVHARVPRRRRRQRAGVLRAADPAADGPRPEHAGLGAAHRLQGEDRAELLEFKAHLEANGVEVLGVTDHGIFHSIYFFDPNGHRLELACPDPDEERPSARLDAVKWEMLEEWSRTRRAPQHAAFLHAREFATCSACNSTHARSRTR